MNAILPMSDTAITKVRILEAEAAKQPQVDIGTQHMFHAGMYARTVKIPAGVMITGALIKIATMLIVSGHCIIYVDGKAKQLRGYNVFAASAKRKQAFVAMTDVYLTMIFPSKSQSVDDAEKEFTDETDLLLSSAQAEHNTVTNTGE